MRHRTTLAATVLAVLLAGCGLLGGSAECRDADTSLTDAAMAVAKEGEQPDQAAIDRVELVEAVAVDLPDDLREYGATRLLAIRGAVYDAQPASSDVPGVEGDAFLAVTDDDELVGPIGEVATLMFDVEPPADPAWSDWAADVEASSELESARACIDPDA